MQTVEGYKQTLSTCLLLRYKAAAVRIVSA